MILYHYRSVESALKELDNCTFHFATRAELNDPMEGYLRVFWQGDENLLHHRSIIVDLHQFDHIPLGKIFQKIGDRFLEDEDIQIAHADEYGDFKFYQAEYDDKGQTIVIRRKGIWAETTAFLSP